MVTTKIEGKPFCPACDTFVNAATGADVGDSRDRVEDITPVAGDFTVCCVCATVLRFTRDLQLVLNEDDVPDNVRKVQRQVEIFIQLYGIPENPRRRADLN